MKLVLNTLFISSFLLFTTTINAQKTNLENSEKIITLAEQNLFNPAYLQTAEWAAFTEFLTSNSLNKLEGSDYAKAFNKKSDDLPFSHFYVSYKSGKKSKKKKIIPFELVEVNTQTSILHIRAFAADATEMVKIVQTIEAKGYKNLIIDLRNNSGGTLDAAVVLGRYLTNNPIDTGTYVTRKWYDEKNAEPTKEDIQNFAFLQDMSSNGFAAIQEEPAFRMVLPGHENPIFKGTTYVLTNTFTASACEPLVHVLKTQTSATLIGEKTAGQMLSADWFDVDENLSVFIPTNDYITAEGLRLDQVGVVPHIETSSKKALDKALEMIK